MNNPSFPIGTNLNGISNSSPQFPFIDYFKSSRDWSISGSENQVSFDADGWVTSLDGDTSVRTSFPNNNLGGQFVVLYEGEGTIGYTGAVKQDKSASVPGRDIVNIEPNKTPGLTITETDPNNNGNYIRNIQIIPAEYENLAESQTFNPDFLKSLEGYQVMRFMDWMSTNNSQISDWDDRPDIESANYLEKEFPSKFWLS
ncbi:MAG: hypothetical protein HC825_08800 [Oscillatoriales cyanobacterium RM1_1_9]|nr:hypothetical protein [Oscillatoriales cyanobacterium RM1_1_9]